MTEVVAAYRAYKQADADALLMRWRARARLGRTVAQKYEAGAKLVDIAKELGVVTEQVRRYQQAYRDWLREHTEAELGEDLAQAG